MLPTLWNPKCYIATIAKIRNFSNALPIYRNSVYHTVAEKQYILEQCLCEIVHRNQSNECDTRYIARSVAGIQTVICWL